MARKASPTDEVGRRKRAGPIRSPATLRTDLAAEARRRLEVHDIGHEHLGRRLRHDLLDEAERPAAGRRGGPAASTTLRTRVRGFPMARLATSASGVSTWTMVGSMSSE